MGASYSSHVSCDAFVAQERSADFINLDRTSGEVVVSETGKFIDRKKCCFSGGIIFKECSTIVFPISQNSFP